MYLNVMCDTKADIAMYPKTIYKFHTGEIFESFLYCYMKFTFMYLTQLKLFESIIDGSNSDGILD